MEAAFSRLGHVVHEAISSKEANSSASAPPTVPAAPKPPAADKPPPAADKPRPAADKSPPAAAESSPVWSAPTRPPPTLPHVEALRKAMPQVSEPQESDSPQPPKTTSKWAHIPFVAPTEPSRPEPPPPKPGPWVPDPRLMLPPGIEEGIIAHPEGSKVQRTLSGFCWECGALPHEPHADFCLQGEPEPPLPKPPPPPEPPHPSKIAALRAFSKGGGCPESVWRKNLAPSVNSKPKDLISEMFGPSNFKCPPGRYMRPPGGNPVPREQPPAINPRDEWPPEKWKQWEREDREQDRRMRREAGDQLPAHKMPHSSLVEGEGRPTPCKSDLWKVEPRTVKKGEYDDDRSDDPSDDSGRSAPARPKTAAGICSGPR